MEKINHPSHYNPGAFEAIKIIEAYDLSFSLGNVIKYVLRAGLKEQEALSLDLKKAQWYLNRVIEFEDEGVFIADSNIERLGNKLSIADIQYWFESNDRSPLPLFVEAIISHLLAEVNHNA